MSWNTTSIAIGVSVDSGGGELQQRGEALLEEFARRVQELCEGSGYNNDAIMVTYCG
jgi:hypothetical protein